MKTEFLENFKIGDQALPKEVIKLPVPVSPHRRGVLLYWCKWCKNRWKIVGKSLVKYQPQWLFFNHSKNGSNH